MKVLRNGSRSLKKPHPLKGLFFLTFDAEGKIGWQGRVNDVLNNAMLLCQLFSWVDGRPTSIVLVNIEEVKSTAPFPANRAHWEFFQDQDEWLEQGERSVESLREHRK